MSASRVLVDSSVWIDFLNGNLHRASDLAANLVDGERAMIGDLILLEVLQGFRSDWDFAQTKRRLAVIELRLIGGADIAVSAAEHYRFLRARGITIRKSIDLLIGTYCIANNIALLHHDRDFDPLEQHLGLRVYRGL